MLSDGLRRYLIYTQRRHPDATTQAEHALADDHRVLCHEHKMLLKLNLFQFGEGCRSWGSWGRVC